ncbi:MAG: fibronectin type III domain-containing protein [Bacteroidetes bacterium]|nr:fibronectin type III domain-containing protein [Bacteroidota bacterium]
MKKVVLKLKERSVPNKIDFARSVVLQMTGNPNFTTPNPALASITTAANDVDAAYVKALNGGPQDTADMRNKEAVLDQLLMAEGYYVEIIANEIPATAEATILSAGMSVKQTGSINISMLSVTQGSVPGSVKLRRKAEGRGVVYKWQMSDDPFSNASWKDAGEGSLASFEIVGLRPVTRYWFRVAVIDGNVQGEFSDPVTFVVS